MSIERQECTAYGCDQFAYDGHVHCRDHQIEYIRDQLSAIRNDKLTRKKIALEVQLDSHAALMRDVVNLLNRHDLQGLLPIGCPSDEYFGEALTIVASMTYAMTSEDLTDLVRETFIEAFWPGAAIKVDAVVGEELKTVRDQCLKELQKGLRGTK